MSRYLGGGMKKWEKKPQENGWKHISPPSKIYFLSFCEMLTCFKFSEVYDKNKGTGEMEIINSTPGLENTND